MPDLHNEEQIPRKRTCLAQARKAVMAGPLLQWWASDPHFPVVQQVFSVTVFSNWGVVQLFWSAIAVTDNTSMATSPDFCCCFFCFCFFFSLSQQAHLSWKPVTLLTFCPLSRAALTILITLLSKLVSVGFAISVKRLTAKRFVNSNSGRNADK